MTVEDKMQFFLSYTVRSGSEREEFVERWSRDYGVTVHDLEELVRRERAREEQKKSSRLRSM